MAYQTTYNQLIEGIGVDPDTIVNDSISSELAESRRCVGINEIILYGWKNGFATIPIIPYLRSEHSSVIYSIEYNYKEYNYKEKGVFCFSKPNGKGHAVYWDGQNVHDPAGLIYDLERMRSKYVIETFWIVKCIAMKKQSLPLIN